MSCKYCDKPAFYAVHHGIKIPPIMTCQKHILKGIAAVFLAQDTYQVTVQDMNKYNLWKARKFTEHYGNKPKVKDNNYYIALVDTWLSGFKSIMDAKPIRITFRYARREPVTMVIKAKDWNNLKLAFLERPEIYKIDDAHLAGGATITHYINRHRAWYLDVWEVARKIKFVFGPLHLDAYQGNCRIEPAPLGFEEDIKVENPTTGEVSFPKPSGFMHIHAKVNPEKLDNGIRIPLTPEQGERVQELLEQSLNTGVSISGRMTSKKSNIAEKPHYLCQTDFCFNCGDRVTNTGSSFSYNQRVVCLKCFKKASESLKCATCGSSKYTHVHDSKVYCDECWDKLPCCQCDEIAGDDCISYNGRIFCKNCYSKLTEAKDKSLEPKVCACGAKAVISINHVWYCRECRNKKFLETHPDASFDTLKADPSMGDPETKDNEAYIKEVKTTHRVCSKCQESKLCMEAVTVDGQPICKICYDRFYNPEINYRCKGCGSIIPDKGKICNKCGPECAHCKTHEGPFKTIDHKLYCHKCAEQCKVRPAEPVKECPECGLPLGNHPVSLPDNHSVCRSCYNENPRCVQCGTAEGPLVVGSESGLKVCKVCYAILHGCPTCGKSVNADGSCDDCSRKDDKTTNG